MKTTIRTEDLIEEMKTNREQHKVLYKEACDLYLERAKELLDKKRAEIEECKMAQLNIHLNIPKNHTAEYDGAIKFYEMSVEKEVQLTMEQFQCFVMDEWNWSRGWFVANVGLTGNTGMTGPTGSSGSSGDTGIVGIADSRGYLD